MTAMAEKSMAVHHLRIASASTLSAWCAFVDGSTSRYGHVRGRAGAGEPSLVASLLPLGKVIRAQLRGWDPSTGWAGRRALEHTPSRAISTCASAKETVATLEAATMRPEAVAAALEAVAAAAALYTLEAALEVAAALTAALRWLRRPSEGGGYARGSGGGAGGSGGARGEGGGGTDGDDSAGATQTCGRDAGAPWSATELQVQVRVASAARAADEGGQLTTCQCFNRNAAQE